MIQSYDLYMPTHLIFGKGRISELKDAVAGAGKKALITYGGGSVKRSGLFTRVKELLESAGCSVSEFGGIEPNPKITSVREGVSLCKDEGIDFVVAVGGGSVLDASKGIRGTWCLTPRKSKPISRFLTSLRSRRPGLSMTAPA